MKSHYEEGEFERPSDYSGQYPPIARAGSEYVIAYSIRNLTNTVKFTEVEKLKYEELQDRFAYTAVCERMQRLYIVLATVEIDGDCNKKYWVNQGKWKPRIPAAEDRGR